MSAKAVVPARPVYAYHPAAPRDAQVADPDDLHGDERLLKIGKDGELPCDSGEWATSSLFGPHAGLAAALGVKPSGIANGARDAALAAALGNSPAAGDADSSTFGSVFGGAPLSIGGLGGGPFNVGGGTGPGSIGGGPVIVGGGTSTGGGATVGGGASPNGGGTGGDAGSIGGGATTGPTGGTAGGAGSTGGDIGSSGHAGGIGGNTGTIPPIDTVVPTNPGSDDHSTGGLPNDANSTRPDAPAAVPEPASWATMLAGFGLIGGVMRARRRTAASSNREQQRL